MEHLRIKRIKQYYIVLISGLLFYCCSEPIETNISKGYLDNINVNEWRTDSLGCNGYRSKSVDYLIKEKKGLIGVTLKNLQNGLLGKANNEYENNSKKYYSYYVDCALAPPINLNEPDVLLKKKESIANLIISIDENEKVIDLILTEP